MEVWIRNGNVWYGYAGSTQGLNVANSFGVLNFGGDDIGQDRPQSQVNDQGSMGKSIPSSSILLGAEGKKDKEVSSSQELHRKWDNCFNPSDAADDDYGYDGYNDIADHLQSSKKDRDYKPQAKTKK